jgi:hypothetical protein
LAERDLLALRTAWMSGEVEVEMGEKLDLLVLDLEVQ